MHYCKWCGKKMSGAHRKHRDNPNYKSKLQIKMDEDLIVIETMEKYGGSFVKALAELARHADYANLNKIKMTWADYWMQYTDWMEK